MARMVRWMPGRCSTVVEANGLRRSGSGLGGSLLDQASHGVGGLGTHAGPVGQAVLGDAQGFLTATGQGVVEADALDETAIAAVALGGNHDVVERTGLRAAAGESNDDHDLSFGW